MKHINGPKELIEQGFGPDEARQFENIARHLKIKARINRTVLCLTALKNLGDCEGSIAKAQMYLSMYDALIISYASCFASTSPQGLQLEKTEIDASMVKSAKLDADLFRDSADLLNFHKKIIRLRNEMVAHNGLTESSESIILYKETEEHIEIVPILSVETPGSAELILFEALIKRVYENIDGKIKKIMSNIKGEIGKNIVIKT